MKTQASSRGPGASIELRLNTTGGKSAVTSVSTNETALALRIVIALTVLAVIPALLVCMTSFLRIIVVLSMLRHALGMQETPPNTVLIGLALFLTLFVMSAVVEQVNREAVQPFVQGQLGMESAYQKALRPLREFMVKQTREQDPTHGGAVQGEAARGIDDVVMFSSFPRSCCPSCARDFRSDS